MTPVVGESRLVVLSVALGIDLRQPGHYPLLRVGDLRDSVNWALAQAASLHPKGVVVDGRDIGSVVFPEAVLKVFLVATPRARALRRVTDLGLQGVPGAAERVEQEIMERDSADSSREIAPLAMAADAIEIDTTEMTFEQQVQRVVALAGPLFG